MVGEKYLNANNENKKNIHVHVCVSVAVFFHNGSAVHILIINISCREGRYQIIYGLNAILAMEEVYLKVMIMSCIKLVTFFFIMVQQFIYSLVIFHAGKEDIRGETIHCKSWYIVIQSSRYVLWYIKIDEDMYRFRIIYYHTEVAVKKSKYIPK